MLNSHFAGNSAQSGGAIYNSGARQTVITSSDFSGNSAASAGGAIFNGGSLLLTNSAIRGNSASASGGGIADGGSGTVTLRHSIVTGNQSTNCSSVHSIPGCPS